jgi:hypothetical protein
VNRFRAALAVAVMSAVIAACGSDSSPSASVSAAASVAESESAAASASADASLPSEAQDLEALIPDQLGDLALQKSSMQGTQFLESGEADPETEQFLQDLGVAPEDIAVAFGFGFSADALSNVGIFVFRAEGADTNRLLDVFKESSNTDRDEPLSWESQTVGGKDVQRTVDPEQNNQVVYLYATGDILFLVSATEDETAVEALEQLP